MKERRFILHRTRFRRTLIAASAALLILLSAGALFREARLSGEPAGEESLFREVRLFLHTQKNEYVTLFDNGGGMWTAFLPAEFQGRDISVSLPAGARLKIGGIVLEDGGCFRAADLANAASLSMDAKHANAASVSADAEHADAAAGSDAVCTVPCEITGIGRTERGMLRVMQAQALPALYILMAEDALPAMHEDIARTERGMYSVRTADGKTAADGTCSMHGRGNYSWDREQKPYSFGTKANASILGMEPAKNYNLISNYMGGVWQLRNRFALETARNIGMEGTPDGRFIDLYVNGEYQGVYFLTGKVKPRGEVFLEMDYRHEKEPHSVYAENPLLADSPAVGNHFVIDDPREPDEAQTERIRAQLQEAVTSLGTPEYTAYFDTPSWARMYAVQEFFVNWDYDYASLFLYRDAASGKYFAGPAWDLEWIAGKLYAGDFFDLTARTRWIDDTEFEDRNMHNGGILKLLGRHGDFHEEADRVLLEDLIPAARQLSENELRTWAAGLAPSVAMEAVRWGRDPRQFPEEYAVFETWLKERAAFLEEQITQPQAFEKQVVPFAWGEVTEYRK